MLIIEQKHVKMNSPSQLPPPSTSSKISPVLLLVIIILAVLVFMYGLLHLLVRVFMKRPSFSAVYQSNRYPSDTSGTHAFQRQLQQLFKLHDSGLDQTFIDALPVFYYNDITGGLKQPFDCPVCLSEFSCHDKLRLLPKCSHAFHVHCIDTWLLSNSSCPLCRGSLLSSSSPMSERNNRGLPIERKDSFLGDGSKSARMEEIDAGEMRVLSVRLGKFTRLNNEGCKDKGHGEASSSNLDARRCYSMGTFQYVEVDSDLQVALKNARLVGTTRDSNAEGKIICDRTRNESFSVSKIWLWSKKNRTQSVGLSLQTNERIQSLVDVL